MLARNRNVLYNRATNDAEGERLIGVSLFSGCGGSDLGAKAAGVDVIFSNDNYLPAIETYRANKSLIATDETNVVYEDICKIDTFPECEILIGCYPCQSFTMGGKRVPDTDERTKLYLQFLKALTLTQPRYFVVENVAGMKWLDEGKHLRDQLQAFSTAGLGYQISCKILDAKDFGVPADRKRLFLVGVRNDVGAYYRFPEPTHGPDSPDNVPYVGHGDILATLPIDCPGEFHHPGKEPFSWWYMSRNRKRAWDTPAFTVVSNWRHITLHPASPTMRKVESRWRDASKEVWVFSGEYDHLADGTTRPVLEVPRRLSWRECMTLQTFPLEMEMTGGVKEKYMQIGNAVPPLLMKNIISPITQGYGFTDIAPDELWTEVI